MRYAITIGYKGTDATVIAGPAPNRYEQSESLKDMVRRKDSGGFDRIEIWTSDQLFARKKFDLGLSKPAKKTTKTDK